MNITIDVSSDVPVFMQLIMWVRDAVQRGHLQPGSSLPAIRQLADDLRINPNTVAKAYRLLERDSVIATRGRHGSVVHAQAKKHSKKDLGGQAFASLTEVIESLRANGLTDSEIRIAFAAVMKE